MIKLRSNKLDSKSIINTKPSKGSKKIGSKSKKENFAKIFEVNKVGRLCDKSQGKWSI